MRKLLLLLLTVTAFACSKPDNSPTEPDPNPITEPGDTMDLAGTAGVLRGSYGLQGTFTADNQGVYINDDYNGNTAPGPVWYLSNSPNSIVGGMFLQDAPTSSGAHTMLTTQALDYDYLVMWCEPFGVLIGFGQIPK